MVAAPVTTAPTRITDAPPPPPSVLTPGLPPPPQPTPVPVDPRTEIVASGTGTGPLLAGYAYWARTLPHPGDDLQRNFGIDIYARIALDPQVRAGLRVLVTSALSQPLALLPAVPDTHPDAAAATAICTFCAANLDRLPGGISAFLAEMAAAALTHGHKVAEILAEIGTLDAAVGPQLLLRDVRPKPLTSTAFVVDAYGNLLGLLAARPGQPLIILPLLMDNHVSGQPLLPVSKFAIWTWDPTNGDPRGQSILRSIYGFWWMKQQTLPLLLAYKTRFGQPSVDIELPPNAADVPQPPLPDGTPQPALSMKQAMLDAGQLWQGGGVFVHPNGSKVKLTEPSGQGYQVFLDTLTLYDNLIVKGLLSATLSVNEGLHRSGTDATTHQDILTLATLFVKNWLATTLRQQVLARLVEWNYGAAAAHALTPRVELGQTDPQDFGPVGQTLAQLGGMGYWNEQVVPLRIGQALDSRMGLPLRTAADTVAPKPAPVAPAAPPAEGAAA